MTTIIDTLAPNRRAMIERANLRLVQSAQQAPTKADEYHAAFRDARKAVSDMWAVMRDMDHAQRIGKRYSDKQGRELRDRLADVVSKVIWSDQCCHDASREEG